MEIVKGIRDLLHQYSCVTIPGFGSFVVRYKPAQMNPVENVFEPPGKVVAFNSSIKDDDSLLVNHLSETSDMDAEEVRKKMDIYASQIKKRLENKEAYEFREIGVLTLDESGNYQFEPHVSANFNGDAFGLEPLKVKKKSREKNIPDIKKPLAPKPVKKEQKKTTTKKKRKFSPGVFALSFLGVAVIAGAMLIFTGILNVQEISSKLSLLSNKTDTSKQSNDYIADSATLNDPVAKSIDSLTDQKTALSPPLQSSSDNIATQNSEFHIIGGSFTSRQNAEEFIQKFRDEGYSPTIIEGKNDFYRVSLKSFSNKNVALKELKRIRRLPNKENTWLLRI